MASRKKLLVTVVTLGLFFSLVGYYWTNSSGPVIPQKQLPMIFEDYSPRTSIASQGSTVRVNLTLSSSFDTEFPLPFRNITISSFNGTSWDSSVPREKIFNYTFSQNPLPLPPRGDNSCIITVNLANDVPIGEYRLFVRYGNASLTHVTGSSFRITVTSPST